MKTLSVYRLCLVGALIVAMMVAWSAAMPRHISHAGNETIGGCLPDCEYSALEIEEWDCSEYSGCSGQIDNDWTAVQDSRPYEYYAKQLTTHCKGGGICDYIYSYEASTDCETP